MAVDERERNALHNRLNDVLGEEAALTLMRHLPPTGWDDLATKQDLAALESRLEARINGTEARLMREMARQTRVFVFATLTAIVTTAGIAFGAAGLS